MTTEMDEMCERYGITATWCEGPTRARDDDGWEHHGGMVLLTHHYGQLKTQRLVTTYRMGMALDPTEMTAADVVASVALDARLGSLDLEEFCSELGYDTDSRKAYASWEECKRSAARFEEFCTVEAMRDDLSYAQH